MLGYSLQADSSCGVGPRFKLKKLRRATRKKGRQQRSQAVDHLLHVVCVAPVELAHEPAVRPIDGQIQAGIASEHLLQLACDLSFERISSKRYRLEAGYVEGSELFEEVSWHTGGVPEARSPCKGQSRRIT